MPKTEVILTHSIVGLGAESDQVKVAAGYARNFLIPQGLAIPLTAANKRRLESLRQRRAEREAHELNTMSELAASIAKMLLKISVKTGADGKMFGSITAGTIVDELKHQCDVSLDKKKVHLEQPIRTLGEHQVELRLHPEVNARLRLQVDSSTPIEAPAPTPGEGQPLAPGRASSAGRAAGAARTTAAPEGRAAKPGREPRAAEPGKAPGGREGRPPRARPERKDKPKGAAAD